MGLDRSRLVLKHFFKVSKAQIFQFFIFQLLHSSVNVSFKCVSVINDDCQDKKRGNRPLVALLGDLIGQPGDMIDHLIDHMRHIFHHHEADIRLSWFSQASCLRRAAHLICILYLCLYAICIVFLG